MKGDVLNMSRTIFLLSLLMLVLVLVSCKDGKQIGVENQSQASTDKSTTPITHTYAPPADQQIPVDSMPKVLKKVMPAYPDSARRNGIEGIVYINALVDEQGSVRKAAVQARTAGVPEFETAALEAVKKWSFTPAMKDNKPVEVWVTIPFRFKLAK